MYSNAGLFRRHARAEDAMLRTVMPKTNARELAALDSARTVSIVGTRNGVRLVKKQQIEPLTATIGECCDYCGAAIA